MEDLNAYETIDDRIDSALRMAHVPIASNGIVHTTTTIIPLCQRISGSVLPYHE